VKLWFSCLSLDFSNELPIALVR